MDDLDKNYNVLLSYPRSANSWIRYAIEFVSRQPTINGKEHYFKDNFSKKDCMAFRQDFGTDPCKPAICLKRHSSTLAHDSWTSADRFIFVIRDYRECILRNIAKRSENKIDSASLMFTDNIKFFDAFGGDKLIVYYEDLVSHPKHEFNKIFEFLEVDGRSRCSEFINNITLHKSKGMELYHDRAATGGSPQKLSLHANRTPKKIVNLIDQKIKSKLTKELYNKYLSRYRPY